jgi:glycine/D-amino acid oxidase-like deaminating enzyme
MTEQQNSTNTMTDTMTDSMSDSIINTITEIKTEIATESATKQFDVIIAGGGIAGILTARKIHDAFPQKSILILEKERHLGGRAITGGTKHDRYGYGLNGLSPRLYDYWNETLKSDPDSEDLPAFMSERLTEVGLLMGQKVSTFSAKDLCHIKGARALGGLAAARQWADVETIFGAEELRDKTFADVWKGTRKAPASLVLETYAQSFGVTDIWESSVQALKDRSDVFMQEPFVGNWDKAIEATLQNGIASGKISVQTSARIVDASLDAESRIWHIDTASGSYLAGKLIVAQPPWQATQWLPKQCLPPHVATLASKTKPVSTVVLTCPILPETKTEIIDAMPQLLFVPAEGSHVIIQDEEVVLKATIDYEMSVVAPDVVKAVKRLKRALRKFAAAYPDLKLGPEHVALVPVGWAQTPFESERKHIDKLKLKNIQSKQLMFCGDAYGTSFDGDVNLIESIQSILETTST